MVYLEVYRYGGILTLLGMIVLVCSIILFTQAVILRITERKSKTGVRTRGTEYLVDTDDVRAPEGHLTMYRGWFLKCPNCGHTARTFEVEARKEN